MYMKEQNNAGKCGISELSTNGRNRPKGYDTGGTVFPYLAIVDRAQEDKAATRATTRT